MRKLAALKQRYAQDLMDIPGVTGVGVRNPRIMVYVETEEIAESLPPTLEGVPVTVRVTGHIRALSLLTEALAASRTSSVRPAPGGVSIGHYAITAGTLGVVGRDATDGELVILSNNHVLANSNRGLLGDSILQPGAYDGGIEPQNRLAGLKRFVEIDAVGGNVVDAAIASPDNPANVTQEILEVPSLVRQWADAQEGMPVQKSGRTTGLTSSSVLDVNASVRVDYGAFEATFDDQIVIDSPSESFGAGGDSGSLVFTQPSGSPVAVGLLFAGSTSIIVANKIRHIIEQLQVTMGVGPGVTFPSLGALPPWIVPLTAGLGVVGLTLFRR